jgi:hypothetical protein
VSGFHIYPLGKSLQSGQLSIGAHTLICPTGHHESSEAVATGASLIIEPLDSIICGRSNPEIVDRSQLTSPQMIDPSGSIISVAAVLLILLSTCWESHRKSLHDMCATAPDIAIDGNRCGMMGVDRWSNSSLVHHGDTQNIVVYYPYIYYAQN